MTVTVPRVPLLSGAEIPVLGLGTWPMDDAEAERVIAKAIGLGYRSFDTAFNYRNETGVGRGLAAAGVPREELFVTTKFNAEWHGVDLVREAFKDAASATRRRLPRLLDDPLAESGAGPLRRRVAGTHSTSRRGARSGNRRLELQGQPSRADPCRDGSRSRPQPSAVRPPPLTPRGTLRLTPSTGSSRSPGLLSAKAVACSKPRSSSDCRAPRSHAGAGCSALASRARSRRHPEDEHARAPRREPRRVGYLAQPG